MAKTKQVWCCIECGHAHPKWAGICSACKRWNTLKEEVEVAQETPRFQTGAVGEIGGIPQKKKAVRISEINLAPSQKFPTGMAEIDRLLGGGIVPGSLTLLGGDPGIGKSTLLLQLAENIAKGGRTVLYICGEESVEQTSLRAVRLGVGHEKLYLLHETLFSQVLAHVKAVSPAVLIVDSIQILYKAEIPSSPGSVAQVRELATEFMHLAKGMGIATFLIGHVTKSGEIAGPKVLEHIVDTVLDFEGDRHHGYRLLRVVKNRFGPTEDIGLFQMGPLGLQEIHSPSEVFLQERNPRAAGSVVIPTLEGSRALLIEVQALVCKAAFATSTRRSAGLDSNRLTLLLAVLEKRAGFLLHQWDVFVSVAGGMKITEPAIDLGVLLAVASSFCNKAVNPELVILGEVGLGGEVRRVARIEHRLKEAYQMGFRKALIPKKNEKEISKEILQKIEVVPLDRMEEAIDAAIS